LRSALWTRDYVFALVFQFAFGFHLYYTAAVMVSYSVDALSTSLATAGLVVGMFSIGSVFAGLVSGKVVKLLGYRRCLLGVSAAMLIAAVLYLIAEELSVILALRLTHGFAFAIGRPATSAIAANVVAGARQSEGVGYYMLLQNVSTAVGPLICIALASEGEYFTVFLLLVIVSSVCLALTPFLRLRVRKPESAQNSRRKGLRLGMFVEKTAIPMSILAMMLYCTFKGVVSNISDFALQIGLSGAAQCFFIIYVLAIIVSRPPTSRIADKYGIRFVLLPSFFVMAFGIALYAYSYNGVMLLSAAAVIGLGFGAGQSSCLASINKTVLHSQLPIASSTFFLFADLGFGSGAVLIGLLINPFGYRMAYGLMALLPVAAFAFYSLFCGRSHNF
jgi:MFS family permease